MNNRKKRKDTMRKRTARTTGEIRMRKLKATLLTHRIPCGAGGCIFAPPRRLLRGPLGPQAPPRHLLQQMLLPHPHPVPKSAKRFG